MAPTTIGRCCLSKGRCVPLQGVCSRVCAIPNGEAPAADRKLLALIADILFMENSRPVHRQLLSGLHRMPPGRFELFKDCINSKVRPS